MDNSKKKVAVIAAVIKYLKTEQEAITLQTMTAQKLAAQSTPLIKVWGLSGRQAQMHIRTMMQMKAFR